MRPDHMYQPIVYGEATKDAIVGVGCAAKKTSLTSVRQASATFTLSNNGGSRHTRTRLKLLCGEGVTNRVLMVDVLFSLALTLVSRRLILLCGKRRSGTSS